MHRLVEARRWMATVLALVVFTLGATAASIASTFSPHRATAATTWASDSYDLIATTAEPRVRIEPRQGAGSAFSDVGQSVASGHATLGFAAEGADDVGRLLVMDARALSRRPALAGLTARLPLLSSLSSSSA